MKRENIKFTFMPVIPFPFLREQEKSASEQKRNRNDPSYPFLVPFTLPSSSSDNSISDPKKRIGFHLENPSNVTSKTLLYRKKFEIILNKKTLQWRHKI